jgi:hypothetical protein
MFQWPFTFRPDRPDRLDRIEANLRKIIMSAFTDIATGQSAQSAEIRLVLAALATDVAALTDTQAKLTAALASQADPVAIDAIVADQKANIAAMAAVLPPPAPAPVVPPAQAPAAPAA